jgi:predicted  nucleic acid-binding Zn-ribbon protein
MAGTDIEKKSLEAHVELCAERYTALETKLTNVENRMDKLESHLLDIKESLTERANGPYKTIITIGTSILGVLIAGIITLLATHFK